MYIERYTFFSKELKKLLTQFEMTTLSFSLYDVNVTPHNFKYTLEVVFKSISQIYFLCLRRVRLSRES